MIDFDNKNKIYICHFPGDTNILQERVQKEIKRKFFLDKKISVVCSFNSNCIKAGILNNVFNYIGGTNDILFEDDVFEQEEWRMEDKINNILKSLKRCKTEYALITDVRDVIITADLDSSFISKFKNMNCDIVYNATTSKYPKIDLPSDNLIEGGSGAFKYLNAGVCFGYTDKLIEWYEHCNVRFDYNKSEQFVMRKMYEPKFNIKIDGERKLFRSCHAYDTVFFKDKKELCLAYTKDAYIEVDKKLKYKYLLPNGKLIKGNLKKIERFDLKGMCYATIENINYLSSEVIEKIMSVPFRKKTLVLPINKKEKISRIAMAEVLRKVDNLQLNVFGEAAKETLVYILKNINSYEYNHISKITVGIYGNFIKEDIFPNDERLKIIWYPKPISTEKYKIIDDKHTGYYFIRLKPDEYINFNKFIN